VKNKRWAININCNAVLKLYFYMFGIIVIKLLNVKCAHEFKKTIYFILLNLYIRARKMNKGGEHANRVQETTL